MEDRTSGGWARLTEQRPEYHLVPPTRGANDVQCIFWRGEYHAFYGLSPQFPLGAPKLWGHAATRDLVRWTHHPPCLEPTPGGPDKDGSWTGCIVDNAGVATAFYTGVRPQAQCMATSRDLITWVKHPGNPVIGGPPAGLEQIPNFRDPCVWREADGWHMAIGSGLPGEGSAVLLYHSDDLIHWDYLHPLFVGPSYGCDMYECPDFFPLDGKHVLLASTHVNRVPKTLYYVGTYADHRFTPEAEGEVDSGPNLYAAKTLVDDRGRRILFGWISEGWSRDMEFIAGWSGAYTVPRVLTLGADGGLRLSPAEEVATLRQRHWSYSGRAVADGETQPIPEVRATRLEIEARLALAPGAEAGVRVRCTPAGAGPQEATGIAYNAAEGCLCLDRRSSSVLHDVNVPKDAWKVPLALPSGQDLHLRVLLDNSVVEVFANGVCCLTGRVYPFLPGSDGVALFARGGMAVFHQLDIWEMARA
ncbi:MAG: glycoside hydrolase family 32 protein [Armatimonadetes bacterium]|nr:glycoside hydrolase family 32 protein [Armatimonadota bacterium]